MGRLVDALSLGLEDLAAANNAWAMTEADSAYVFCIRAVKSAPLAPDDPRTMTHFKPLRIREFWTYDATPVSRMSQQEIATTAFAMQWLLLSEIYVRDDDRTEAWFDMFEDLLHLVRMRVYDLIANETSRDVLDGPDEYVEPLRSEEEERARQKHTDYDYDSDEEKRASARVSVSKSEIDAELAARAPHRASERFAMDMDSVFRSIDSARCAKWLFAPTLRRCTRNVHDIRAAALNQFKQIRNEIAALEHRRLWVQRLLVAPPSYTVVHRRKRPFDKRPAPRAILVHKRDKLAEISVPKSMDDVVTPAPLSAGPEGSVDMRMSADAALFYASASVPNEDRVSEVWIGTIEWTHVPVPCTIGRLLATQQWVVFMPDGSRVACKSFCAAFVELATQDARTKEFIKTRFDIDV